MLRNLNGCEQWRAIYGKHSKVLKDEELILRFLALYYFSADYASPMKEFLNTSTEKLIKMGELSVTNHATHFTNTMRFIHDSIGEKAFKPDRSINAAVFDSVMVGTARRLAVSAQPSPADYKNAYDKLLSDGVFINLYSQATANEKNVSSRLDEATKAFSDLKPNA